MKEIPTSILLYFLFFTSVVNLNCLAEDSLGQECQKATAAVAPARVAINACLDIANCLNQSISDSTSDCSSYCKEEIQEMFKIGLIALEKCAQINPELACTYFADVRTLCRSQDDCTRANNIHQKYCTHIAIPTHTPKSERQIFAFAENFYNVTRNCLPPRISFVFEAKGPLTISAEEMHAAIYQELQDKVCPRFSSADAEKLIEAKLNILFKRHIPIKIFGYSYESSSKNETIIPLAIILSDGSGYLYGGLKLPSVQAANLSAEKESLLRTKAEEVLLKSDCQQTSSQAIAQIEHEILNSFNELESEQTFDSLQLSVGRVCN